MKNQMFLSKTTASISQMLNSKNRKNAQLSSQLEDSTEAMLILIVKFEAAEKVEKDELIIRIVTYSNCGEPQ
jgi:phosphoribosyl-dephospho-CoA transferase